MSKAHLFLIDNLDSFSYNLVDEMRKLGHPMTVYRNTVDAQVILQKIAQVTGPKIIVLSPGPGEPSKAGCMPALLASIQGQYPVLGICLGHQAIVEHHGGHIGRADTVMHGKASGIACQPHPIFQGLPNPLSVARYHSLMAKTVPDGLEVLAQVDGIPMAVYAASTRMLGFQFHPESILTSHGAQLLKQSLDFLTEQAV